MAYNVPHIYDAGGRADILFQHNGTYCYKFNTGVKYSVEYPPDRRCALSASNETIPCAD
ncbi:hypothetical protein AGMMS49983_14060 [Clostridia bacterium]|nr:hypothetical protein AGMMS49983_14060 [Clostridia bacterium]